MPPSDRPPARLLPAAARSRSPSTRRPSGHPAELLAAAASSAQRQLRKHPDVIWDEETASSRSSRSQVPPWCKKSTSRSQSPASAERARTRYEREAASSASVGPPGRTQSTPIAAFPRPRPCELCHSMPWQCVCLNVPRTVEEERSAYQIASRIAGIWGDTEVIDQEASEFVAREESPEPVQEKDMWACPRCKSLNSRHELLCQVKVDEPLSGTEHVGTEPGGWVLPNWTHELLSLLLEVPDSARKIHALVLTCSTPSFGLSKQGCCERRELAHTWRAGDWFCEVCRNHNFQRKTHCNWSQCVTNRWTCQACGNYNYQRREFCNRGKCGAPRPWCFRPNAHRLD